MPTSSAFSRRRPWGYWVVCSSLCSLLWFAFWPTPSTATVVELTGRVATVHSGQSLEVLLPGSSLTQAVRLAGIDAPDPQQEPWGAQATAALQQRLVGQSIRLELAADSLAHATDAYGRLWAYLWVGNDLVNADLLAAGWGLMQEPSQNDLMTHIPYTTRFSHAQEQARILGRGIWATASPMRQSPSQFRATLE